MATLKLENINKVYDGDVHAVIDFNLDIKDKEFIVFVGPSGCGKSTTLRMIAGLEEITSGDLYINDERMNDIAPKDRNISMVFQSYALYPHMTVFENMAFGLRHRKVPDEEVNKRVTEAAKTLEIEPLLDRKPKALSGGQRQRVALGRAIVRNANVFLMDEPLSNLDAKLRVQMRSEIIKLHEKLETTTIYVTHDQTEAMTMATRIVVMYDGYVQQIGTPNEIYNNPVNKFVAGFLGAPATNFLNVTYIGGAIKLDKYEIELPQRFCDSLEAYQDKEIILGIRPEAIHTEGIVKETYPTAVVDFDVEVSELLGHESILHGSICGEECVARVESKDANVAHQTIKVAFDLNKVHFFDKETEKTIV